MSTKWSICLSIVIVALLSSCITTPTRTSTPTELPKVSNTMTATVTPTATQIPTSTTTPIATSTPTATAVPPLVLAPFEVQIIGMEEHGNMACIEYQGTATDLDEVIFHATFYQNDFIMERNIKPERINGHICFEMLDAKYETAPVELELKATLPYDSEIAVSEDSKIRTYNLGEYQVVPFLRWIFGENSVDKNVFGGFRNNHRGWDLKYSTDDFPNSVGTPIYAIADGEMIINQIWYPYGENSGYVTNIYAKLNDVGILWQFGHIDAENPPVKTETCVSFLTGDLVANIGKKDAASSAPHVHFGLQTIISSYRNTIWEKDNLGCSFINPFTPDPFGDGTTNLQYGLWLPEYLPQDVKNLIDNGFFEQHFFSSYAPCFTSPEFNMDSVPDFPCDN